jgi:hypothetical protein
MADKPPAPIYRAQGNSLFRTDAGDTVTKRGQDVPYNINGAPTGAEVADGDYGDITVASGVWTIDPHVVGFSKMVAASAAGIVGATVAGDFAQLTPAQAKTVLAITASDISGLGYFATGTDAANLTGTVAAARFPALTGDVTTAAGTVATAIAAGAVTLPKMANVATATVFYRKTAGTGSPEVQTLATLKADLGLTGTNSGDQTITLTGPVTGSGTGSFATTIAANVVANTNLAQIATATFKGRTSAGTGNVEDLTATQATALLNSFTSLLKGLVPASGGGTANFLRADATWAAPATGAAGSDRQVQFNNAGALAGAGSIDIDADGNLRADYAASVTTPGADQITSVPQRIAASGGTVLPRFVGEDGIKTTMQAHIGRNSVVWGQALGGFAGNITLNGASSLGNVGTATARNVATTNRLTRAKRVGYVSASTAGNAGALENNGTGNTQWTVGGASGAGFLAVFRWGCSDAATVAGAHMFVGMRSSTADPSRTVSPATLTNQIGVAQLNGGANLNIVYGGSAAQTAIDLGASFPAADTTALYELILYARPDDATKVAYRVENIGTGAVASGVLTGVAGTALPANTTLLGPMFWRSNNATALAVGIDIASLYIASDI